MTRLQGALLGLVTSLLFGCGTGVIAQQHYASVPSNVSFNAVMALPFREADEVIAYGSDPLQFGRLWRAPDSARANLVFIHGGCWLNAYDMAHSYPLSSALSARGFNVWSLEYRRTGDEGGGWPGTFDDILAGIDQLGSVGLDNTLPTLVLGHSAGGHLALLAGARRPGLDGVIGLAAISDIRRYAAGANSCEIAAPQFMGGLPNELAEQYSEANPAEQTLHSTSLLLYGSADTIVGSDQAVLPGIHTEIESGAGHFDWVHPGTPAFQLLVDSIEQQL